MANISDESPPSETNNDVDVLVIGSGFGGSVAACRFAESGKRVVVLEQGKRYRPGEFAKSAWDLKRYLWAPALACKGIMGIRIFKDLVVFHGVGVGGGSLVYANTHVLPHDDFYRDSKWAHLADWQAELAPYFEKAAMMLGSTEAPRLTPSDELLKRTLEASHDNADFKKHRVGVYFGDPENEVDDPYFGGRGPKRIGCNECGKCMVGCDHGAKNTLDKNYLHLAEENGAKIFADSKVETLIPLSSDGSAGYEVQYRRDGIVRSIRAKKLILSAGVLGSVELLLRNKHHLPNLSAQLGQTVRTNSESIEGIERVTKPDTRGLAITSGGWTKDGTHIELFRYGRYASALFSLSTVHTPGGRFPRAFHWLLAVLRHPFQSLRRLWPQHWSRDLVGVLAMRTSDTSMKLELKRPWFSPWKSRLSSAWNDNKKPPAYMPDVQAVSKSLAKELGGVPSSVLPETLLDTVTTAHILGGCSMGASKDDGVIDKDHKLFGYENFWVIDASAISANLGVNPSLTITAMAERACARILHQHHDEV